MLRNINNFLKKYLIYFDRNKPEEPVELETPDPLPYVGPVEKIQPQSPSPYNIYTPIYKETKQTTFTMNTAVYECAKCGSEITLPFVYGRFMACSSCGALHYSYSDYSCIPYTNT